MMSSELSTWRLVWKPIEWIVKLNQPNRSAPTEPDEDTLSEIDHIDSKTEREYRREQPVRGNAGTFGYTLLVCVNPAAIRF